jgi:hypothetical protein
MNTATFAASTAWSGLFVKKSELPIDSSGQVLKKQQGSGLKALWI